MLAAVGKDSFYYKPAAEAYKLVMTRLRDTGNPPDWSQVVSDPSIGEDARKILKSTGETPAISKAKVQSMATVLDNYRKLRGLVALAQTVMDNVEDKQVDLDALIESTSDSLVKVRSRGDTQAQLYHFGRANNSTDIVKQVLYGKKKPMVPTGFAAFDRRNGGILNGSLVLLAANTGGAKTTVGANLLRNITEFAAEDTVLVSLEMSAQQMTDRLLGILSGVDVSRISQQKLSAGERKLIKKSYQDYVNKLKGLGTRYTIYEPQEDVGIEEVLMTLKPMGYKVILIDYISLLKGADGDDQWRQLGNIARFAKVFAKNHNIIVVLLCQVTDEGMVRYSRTMVEHANNAFVWVAPQEECATMILEIKQLKARNQQRFNFQLLANNSNMQITDVDHTGTDYGDENETDKTDEGSGGKKLRDLNDGDEDGDGDEDDN